VVGLHGAGLVNGVFAATNLILVELKTKYGYDTDIFARVADSRNGTYVHIDARKYSVPKRVNSADNELADRVTAGIEAALQYQQRSDFRGVYRISIEFEDYVMAPVSPEGSLSHLLGPTARNISTVCTKYLPYADYREKILGGKREQYCQECEKGQLQSNFRDWKRAKYIYRNSLKTEKISATLYDE